MKESEIEEYANKLKQNPRILGELTQEIILEILKGRVKYELNWSRINELEKALDKKSIEKIIDENDEFEYEKTELLKLVVRTKDIDFINKKLDIMISDEDRESMIDELARILAYDPYIRKDIELRRTFIEKREEYNFSSSQMKLLMREVGSYEGVIECIEKPEKYGMNENDAIELISCIDYPKYVLETFKDEISSSYDENVKIKLPNQMTIGVEIESKGPASKDLANSCFDYKYVEEIFIEDLGDWEIEEDGSLEKEIDAYSTKIEGIEFISPVLRTGEKAENEIYQACTFLKYCKQNCDEETGGHIHIGADYLTNINAYKNLIEIWTNSEKILYTISNKEGETPREVGEYAPPFSKKMKETVENGLEEENLEQFIEKIKGIQGERYSSINFLNIGDENKNTIEFRLSNGTINPKTWIENINLFGGLIVAAQELSVIQERVSRGEEITEQEKEKLSAFEKITTLENTKENEEKKLKALLDLCINKDEQDIYLNRYAVNKELIKDRAIVENVGVIRINRKQIGKLAFTGQEQINGVEYQQAKQIIEDDLLRDVKENNSHTISE